MQNSFIEPMQLGLVPSITTVHSAAVTGEAKAALANPSLSRVEFHDTLEMRPPAVPLSRWRSLAAFGGVILQCVNVRGAPTSKLSTHGCPGWPLISEEPLR